MDAPVAAAGARSAHRFDRIDLSATIRTSPVADPRHNGRTLGRTFGFSPCDSVCPDAPTKGPGNGLGRLLTERETVSDFTT